MYDKLGTVKLKTEERMEVGVITAPDAPHAEEVKQFLGHKGGNWEWHIQRCVIETLDALETRFYVGKLDGRVITNIMTVEHEGSVSWDTSLRFHNNGEKVQLKV